MNILIDLISTSHGGGYSYIYNQLKALSNIHSNYNFILVCSDNEIAKKFNKVGYNILLMSRIRFIMRLNQLISEYKIRLIYSPNNFMIPLVKVPSIVLYQNVKAFDQGIDRRNLKDIIKYCIIGILRRFSEKLSTCNIYVSKSIKRLSYRNYKKDKVLYSGVNFTISRNMKKDGYILAVSAGYMKHKNLDVIKEALGIYNKTAESALDLVIAGQLTKTGDYPHIKYTGYLSEKQLIDYYNRAALYISASKAEAFPLTPFEAMSQSTPCILSNIPIFREIAGNAAIYFNPDSKNELSDKIGDLMNDDELYKELVNRGYERIKHFSWEKNAKKLLEVIETSGER